MRIAFVHDYSMEHIGGSPTSLLEQKRALEAAGHTVFVIQLANKPAKPSYDNSNFLYIKPHYMMSEAQYNMAYVMATRKHDALIQKLLLENEIEIVHTQSELTLSYAVVRNAKQLGIPVVSTVHSFYWGESLPKSTQATTPLMNVLLRKATRTRFKKFPTTGKPATRAFKNWILNLTIQSDVVVSPSQHQADDMKKVWPDMPVVTIPNPLRNLINTQPELVSPEPHLFRLAWAGRVVAEKRPVEFMRAIQIARGLTDIPFQIDLIGAGTAMNDARRFNLPNVTFHGKKSHQESVALIDQADAFCITSYHYDNQPMVIAEALSRYRPVIYCDEQLTEGVDTAGYLSDDPSPEAMARAIVDFVEHPEKVRELSIAAKTASEIFLPETYVKNIVKVYASLLAKK